MNATSAQSSRDLRSMLTNIQRATIKYCFSHGVAATELAKRYDRTPQRIYQIAASQDLEIFGSEDAKSWFDAGVAAAKACFPQNPDHIDTNRLVEARRARRMTRDGLIETRTKNLPVRSPVEEDRNEGEDVVCYEVDAPETGNDINDAAIANLILENMSENLRSGRRRYEPVVMKFAYILRSYSAVCYDYMRRVLPLPSRQAIAANYKEVERKLTRCYEDPEQFDYVITSYFDRHPLPNMNQPLTCTLSIDAFSISVFENKFVENPENKFEVAVERVAEDELMMPKLPLRPCNSVFLLMLNPLNWNHPSAVLSAFPWQHGHAEHQIVKYILECVMRLKKYNIEVCALATDGDSGYNILHDACGKLWMKSKFGNFLDILNKVIRGCSEVRIGKSLFRTKLLPIADPLHAIKIARSRVLSHVVFLAQGVVVSERSFKTFCEQSWFKDRTQLAKLSDFYAISMFDADTLLQCYEQSEYTAAIYLWPWLSLVLVIRSPFLSSNCRLSLLNSAFNMCQFFYNQDLKLDFGDSKVTTRAWKQSAGVSFFEPNYLLRVLHLIICLYNVLLNHNQQLRMSALGSHVNENVIGRIRVACHGNPRFDVVQRAIAKAEVRRVLQAELGIEHVIRGRDNVGGTKLDSGNPCDLEGKDFVSLTDSLIQSLRTGSIEGAAAPLREICEFLRLVSTRSKESYHIYQPNQAANCGVMARLIKFKAEPLPKT